MYLTQMYLNPARRGTRNLLASPQRMHAAVMLAFPPGVAASSEGGRVLWRIDSDRTTCTLYVSSSVEPDLTHLVEQAGWPTASSSWRTASTNAFHKSLASGQEWMFRLTANPVHSERNPNGGRGKRYAHVTVAQQEDWLRERCSNSGFEAVTVVITNRRRLTFSRQSDGTTRTITLTVATFDGTLRVTDPEALRMALTCGVGRAKSYGCGLITLAPMR